MVFNLRGHYPLRIHHLEEVTIAPMLWFFFALCVVVILGSAIVATVMDRR